MIWFALTGIVAGAACNRGKRFANKVEKGMLKFNKDAPYYKERLEAYERAIGSIGKTEDSKEGSPEEQGDLHIDYSNLDGLAKAIAEAADSAFETLSAKIKKGEYK